MDDQELLSAYVDGRDEEAFAQLVRLHGDWVQAAARRQLRDRHLAEDTAQAVFMMLARRAGKLKRYAYLGGWLYRAMEYCVRETQRHRSEEHLREQEVAKMRHEEIRQEANWEEIAPVLEAAVGKLGKKDREVVLLRFYQRKPLAEVGECLGISEKAAQKRVERAVGKLREKLAGKGVEVEAGSLGAMVLAHAAGGGMEGGAAGLVEKVMAGIGGGGGNGTAGLIAKGAEKMMTMAKVQVAAVIVLVVLAAGIGAGLAGIGGGATTQVSPPAQGPSEDQASAPAKPLLQLQPGQIPSAAEVLDSVWANIARYHSWDVTYTAESYAADGSGQSVGSPKTTAKVKWRKQGGTVYAESVDAVRGTQKVLSTATQTTLLSTGGRDIFPTATILKDGSPDSVSGGTVETMLRGIELPPLKATAQMTVTRDAATGNILLRDPRGAEALVLLEIDPARDWAVVKGEAVIGGKTTGRVAASDYRKTKLGLWIPYRYSQQAGDAIMVYTVDSADVNIDIPAESMKLDIPLGTRVHDRIAGKVYREW